MPTMDFNGLDCDEKLDLTYYQGTDIYSDGEEIEKKILEIVSNYPDQEFRKIIAESNSWPVAYHLSPERTNCVEWIDIGHEETVLEIGSGCGAITGSFARKAKQVDCVELSKLRSQINAIRNQYKKTSEYM